MTTLFNDIFIREEIDARVTLGMHAYGEEILYDTEEVNIALEEPLEDPAPKRIKGTTTRCMCAGTQCEDCTRRMCPPDVSIDWLATLSAESNTQLTYNVEAQ